MSVYSFEEILCTLIRVRFLESGATMESVGDECTTVGSARS